MGNQQSPEDESPHFEDANDAPARRVDPADLVAPRVPLGGFDSTIHVRSGYVLEFGADSLHSERTSWEFTEEPLDGDGLPLEHADDACLEYLGSRDVLSEKTRYHYWRVVGDEGRCRVTARKSVDCYKRIQSQLFQMMVVVSADAPEIDPSPLPGTECMGEGEDEQLLLPPPDS